MFVGKSRLVDCIPINSPMKSPVYQCIFSEVSPKISDLAQNLPFYPPHLPRFFIDFPWIWPSFYIFQPLSTVPWVSPGHTSRTLDLAQKGPKVKHKRPSNSTAPLTSGKTCWKTWEIGWYHDYDGILCFRSLLSLLSWLILIVHYYCNYMVMGQNLGTQTVCYFVG